jgi:hypothetical protein
MPQPMGDINVALQDLVMSLNFLDGFIGSDVKKTSKFKQKADVEGTFCQYGWKISAKEA